MQEENSAITCQPSRRFFGCVPAISAALQALLPVIRESLYLTRHDVGNAGITAVVGAVASRVMMGNMVDTFGPRYGFAFLLLLTAPAIYCMSMVTSEC